MSFLLPLESPIIGLISTIGIHLVYGEGRIDRFVIAHRKHGMASE